MRGKITCALTQSVDLPSNDERPPASAMKAENPADVKPCKGREDDAWDASAAVDEEKIMGTVLDIAQQAMHAG